VERRGLSHCVLCARGQATNAVVVCLLVRWASRRAHTRTKQSCRAYTHNAHVAIPADEEVTEPEPEDEDGSSAHDDGDDDGSVPSGGGEEEVSQEEGSNNEEEESSGEDSIEESWL
jgi:hypothetical protein